MIDQAQEIKDLGFNVGLVSMPEKFPVGVNWKQPPSLKNWPKYKDTGVCIFTGEVEIIDVDSKHWKESGNFSDIFLEFIKTLPFYEKLVCYKTLNNGLQFPYRTANAEGNQKLAIRLTGPEAIIETRGIGGLAVCPPTKGYEWLNGGEWEAVPTLTEAERKEFISACKDWNQGISIEIPEEIKSYKENSGRPGDDWASKNDFIAFIKDHEWEIEKVIDGCVLLRRPGKKSGISASWNYGGLRRFYVWSSSTSLPTQKLLKPFAVKAYLEHDGDFKACALALREQGYGNDALAILEACEDCQNWGEVALILQENKEIVSSLDSNKWNELSYGLQAREIKGLTESKLEKFKKGAITKTEVIGWEDKLTRDEDEKVRDRIYNIDLILNNDPRYKEVFFFDDFNQRVVVRGKKGELIEFDDTYMARLRVRLGREWGHFRAADIEAVIVTIAKNNHFHPMQEKIKSIAWDGVPRADTWLSKYCGAKDSSYTRTVSRKWLISAIARLFSPGCKVDNVLVLEGEQGTRKSSMLRALCYDNFLDGGIDIRGKDGLMALFGKWVVEFSELEGLNGRSSDTIKAFLAKQDDKIRLPYGKSEQYFKRTCVFVGTTNKNHYLEDPTGNRRFWPVQIDFANISKIENDRDQIWAEAYQLFRNGENWWVDEESEAAKDFRIEQGHRVIHSDLEDKIIEYAKNYICEDGKVRIRLHEVWEQCLGGKISQIDRKKEHEIAECLRRIGLKKVKSTFKGVQFKGWYGSLEGAS